MAGSLANWETWLASFWFAAGTKSVWHTCGCCHSFYTSPPAPAPLLFVLSSTLTLIPTLLCLTALWNRNVWAQVRSISTCLRHYSLYNKNIKYFFPTSLKTWKLVSVVATLFQYLPSSHKWQASMFGIFLILYVFLYKSGRFFLNTSVGEEPNKDALYIIISPI